MYHAARAGAGARAAAVAKPGGGRLTCDIYRAAGTPCVGAYSTVRALYAAYRGPLYQVTRASDGTARNIAPLSPGGVADAAAQDAFCATTSCTITEIFDQSPEHNDLGIEGAGGNGAADVGAPAAALPVQVHGHRAYGVKISAGTGYRDDHTSGMAVNGEPESMYMVTSSQFVNGQCCFDFGNAETSNDDTGNGHMDAVSNLGTGYFYEGVMTAGLPSDTADDAVQAGIVAAGYGR